MPTLSAQEVKTHDWGGPARAFVPAGTPAGGVAQGRARLLGDTRGLTGATRVVTRADAALISRFRQAQYRRSPDLTLTDESVLLWDEGDDLGIVLAVRAQDGSFLSTMRAEPLRDTKHAARALDCQVPIADSVFPAMILGRGATREDCQHLGLNSLMRLHFLRFARQRGIRHVYGRVYGQAARTNLMRSIGYAFFRHPKGAEVSAGTAGAHSDLHVAVLDLEVHGETATGILEARASELLARFPLVDQLSSRGFTAGELPRTTHPRQVSQEAPRYSGAFASAI